MLEYLRGSASNEGTATLNFRTRISPLGDIVDASPKYVGIPNLPYQDFADPGYSAFKTAQATRSAMVYVAANDGMLHAFADSNGTEKFAYIPRVLFRTSENAGLAALTLKEGALPPFVHHFYVDSTPKVVDVDFGSQNWHTILVGGLGKGGNAYYALDVTSPDSVLTEANAASDVLWEFTDSDLGYTYGAPIITKTAGFGGKWVVIVPSGYNNPSGVGKIWVLDAKTGAVLTTLSTGFGSSTSPSGLAQIAGFTQDYHNYMTDEVYGGDQYGNVWRFDLRDPDADQVVGRTVREAHGSGRQHAARHDGAADRDRHRQRRRSLGVRGHGPAARHDGPRRSADPDVLRAARRHAEDAKRDHHRLADHPQRPCRGDRRHRHGRHHRARLV